MVQEPDALQTKDKIISENPIIESYNSGKDMNKFNKSEENKKFNYQDLTGYLSITTDAIEDIGGLEKAQELLESGKWKAEYMGETKTWSIKFFGNGSVSAELVQSEKVAFIGKAAMKSQILRVVKGSGYTLNLVGIVIVADNIFEEGWTPENKADAVFTGLGLTPGIGWGLAIIGIEAKLAARHFEKLQMDWNNTSRYKTSDPANQHLLDQEMKNRGIENMDNLFR